MTAVTIKVGFVPLVDCAPLVIARELDFAAQEGVSIEMMKQPSWASLRDLLGMGYLDAAHMLSPLPVAMSLGLGGYGCAVDAMMVLSVNGTVIGASNDLVARMRAQGFTPDLMDAQTSGAALARAVDGPLRFGVPFPVSMHRELTEFWLEGRDLSLQLLSVPPPLMAEALENGEIDAFCVGEPWGSKAVEIGAGELILAGSAIWAFAPEKVLAARKDWIACNLPTARALMRALYKAGKWLSDPTNAMIATDILARPEYLDLPADIIERAMSGVLITQRRAFGVPVPGFMRFHEGVVNFPWRSQAGWIGARLARRHGLEIRSAISAAANVFRADLYRDVMGPMGVDLPGASSKLEGSLTHPTAVASTRGEMILQPDRFYNGAKFDPDI